MKRLGETRCDEIRRKEYEKITKKKSQVKQFGNPTQSFFITVKKDMKARARQLLVGNPACLKTLKSALTARRNPQ